MTAAPTRPSTPWMRTDLDGKRIALVNLPLYSSRSPRDELVRAASTLRGRAREVRTHHLDLAFAQRIGWTLNDALSAHHAAAHARAVVGSPAPIRADAASETLLLGRAELERVRAMTRDFFTACLHEVHWAELDVVMFSGASEQRPFVRSLVARLQARHPDLEIIVGLDSVAGDGAQAPHHGSVTRSDDDSDDFPLDDFFADALRHQLPPVVGGEELSLTVGQGTDHGRDILAQIDALAGRYGAQAFTVSEQALPSERIEELFGAVYEKKMDYRITYACDAGLSADQLEVLGRGGCRRLIRQALSVRSASWLDHVNLLKWARYYRIRVDWVLQGTEEVPVDVVCHLAPPRPSKPVSSSEQPDSATNAWREAAELRPFLFYRRGPAEMIVTDGRSPRQQRTHLLGPVAAALVEACARGPVQTDALLDAMDCDSHEGAVTPDSALDVLQELDDLGLILTHQQRHTSLALPRNPNW